MGCHSLLQGIFPTGGLNPGLLHCGQMLYRLSHQGSSFLLFKTVHRVAGSDRLNEFARTSLLLLPGC